MRVPKAFIFGSKDVWTFFSGHLRGDRELDMTGGHLPASSFRV